MSRTHTVVPSPIGPLTVVAEDGALVRLAMSPPSRFVDAEIGERSDEGVGDVGRQLGEYFAGDRTALPTLVGQVHSLMPLMLAPAAAE